jgi:hypothetical protein
MRLWLAIRLFFAVLLSGERAERAQRLLSAEPPGEPERSKPISAPARAKPASPPRSDALTLLATLQREARFVDFVEESLEGYSDAQIGAAARDVHRDCGRVLRRMFEIQPLIDDPEGAAVELPPGFDAGRYHLTGNVTGQPPFRGQLAHHGWQATKCDLPTWSGKPDAALLLAPAEVELS